MTSYVFEYRGCPLHYWLTGPQDAPLVVFTHGADMNHESWDGIVPLAAQRYRVLTWDVRLHGLSRPGGEPYTVRTWTNQPRFCSCRSSSRSCDNNVCSVSRVLIFFSSLFILVSEEIKRLSSCP
jgi:pimeloyl-ACP methyl ester carboxylesterase